MPEQTHIIQRAFHLAKHGECTSVGDIKSILTREGYENVFLHLAGPTITRQLREAIATAKEGENFGQP